jgi:hypothetical protein
VRHSLNIFKFSNLCWTDNCPPYVGEGGFMSTMGSGVRRAGGLTADWPGASSEGPKIDRTDRIRRDNTLVINRSRCATASWSAKE